MSLLGAENSSWHVDEGAAPDLLHQFFEKQVGLRPDHIAVECDGTALTYAALEARANQIARFLHARRIGPGSLVGLCFQKSCSAFASLLGILKAGAGYVPIDPRTPLQRIESIIETGSIELIISEGAFGTVLQSFGCADILLIDRCSSEIDACDATPLPVHETGVTLVDSCYVIFTSGSTGKPKGVVVEHQHVVNFVRSFRAVYRLSRRDRIFQGFSLAFDASVEEIWAAFSLGGTLVVPTEDVARSPADTANFISTNAISFFSTVPSFLAMIDAELPTVRLLVVGGEDCPAELVSRWARSRRMLNTYGPTEATIVATAAECVPGRPVTIGTALPGYTIYVLDEQLRPIGAGEVGELFIGGRSVARGYLGQERLTTERFLSDKFTTSCNASPRMFRTHDLVRILKDGSLQFVGRRDTLVKVRGFRIELAEIEAVLMEQPGVRAALATVFNNGSLQEIGAFVVPMREANEIDQRLLAHVLRKRLPEYMVPRFLDVIDDLPLLNSGKADRTRLPPSKTLLMAAPRHTMAATTPMEATLVKSYEACVGTSPVYVSDDFLVDLGGHSLLAGRIVSDLRPKLKPSLLTMRDIYEKPTIKQLASYLESIGVSSEASASTHGDVKSCDVSGFGRVSNRARSLCAVFQALCLLIFYGIFAAPFIFFVLIGNMVSKGELSFLATAQLVTIVSFFVWPSWLLISIGVKWLVIGRFKPGRYPLWGNYYFRWWVVNLFQTLSWSTMFVGTPLMSVYYRAMGASVGRNSTISTPFCTAYDGVAIGEGTSIGPETHLLGYRVENGWLIIGKVAIGDHCFVGAHSNLGLDVAMGDRSRLGDMSLLADNSSIPAGEARSGSPAKPSKIELASENEGLRGRRSRCLFGALHLGLIYVMGYLLILSVVPAVLLVGGAFVLGGPAYAAAATFVAVPIFGVSYLLVVIGVKYFAIRNIRPGLYRQDSFNYLRIWFFNYLLNNMRHILLPLYATLLFPTVLRLLGAKVGSGAEVSAVMHVTPDLMDLGEGCFLADACMIGAPRIHGGMVEVQPNRIGRRTFIGNSAHVPGGIEVSADNLVGVMSTPPEVSSTPAGKTWLGSPSFELRRTQLASCYSEETTFRPRLRLVWMRASMEVMKILLPALVIAADLVLFATFLVMASNTLPLTVVLLMTPCIAAGLAFLTVCVAALAKIALIGTFKPEVKPLWTPYVWANEIVNGLYESTAAVAVAPLMGTPFIGPCLRLMGCKVGRWAFIETTLFSEFDLVHIGNEAALNLGATVQTHLFEDRIMKSGNLTIGDRCSIGNMSVILYGTYMQEGSTLSPLSLLMKGEDLPSHTRWGGIPIQLMLEGSSFEIAPSLVPEAASTWA